MFNKFKFILYIAIVLLITSCKNDKIAIFLASDDNYSPYVATTMASVLKNTNSNINFYILEDEIKEKNKDKIQSLHNVFKSKKFTINFIKIDGSLFDGFHKRKDGKISRTSYAKFLIPSFEEAKKYEKVIYLDCDVIAQKDIKEFFNEDLNKYPLGAMSETFDGLQIDFNNDRYTKFFNGEKNHTSFNSGIMIFDIKKWNSNNMTEKLMKFAKENANNPNVFYQDQDVFNIVFNNNYKKLDKKYCTLIIQIDLFRNKCQKENKAFWCLKEYNQEEYEKWFKNAVLIHYTGEKPWNDKNVLFSEKFWEIVKYTDFDEEIHNRYYNVSRKKLYKDI